MHYGANRIKKIELDNAREYLDSAFQQFLESKDIIHQTSCVCTPQQNGIAERKKGPF